LEALPHPLLLGGGAKQLIDLVVHDGITSAVHMPFNVELPNALASPISSIHANDMLSVLHGKPNVEDELLKRGCLVAALGGIEVGAVVLISADGYHCGESEGTERNQPGRSS